MGKQGRRKVLKDINLLEFLNSYQLTSSGNRVKLTVVFPAGSTTNINPTLLSDEIEKRALRLEKEPGQQGVDKQNAHHDGADQNDGVGQYEIQY
jgi:hypothetical protein